MEEMLTSIGSFAPFWINKDKYLSLLLSIRELIIVKMCGSCHATSISSYVNLAHNSSRGGILLGSMDIRAPCLE